MYVVDTEQVGGDAGSLYQAGHPLTPPGGLHHRCVYIIQGINGEGALSVTPVRAFVRASVRCQNLVSAQ